MEFGMTERLYYHDSDLLEFESKVIKIDEKDGLWRIYLDSTAFYPTSGGQLFDTGTLNEQAICEVLNENGDIAHIMKTVPDFKSGQTVLGKIDPERRRDNKQKHTGQHILSRSFIETCEAVTVSAHLGEEDSTIDLDASGLTDEQIVMAENLANDIIYKNRPVRMEFVSGDELAKYPLRKIPADKKDQYRLIIIEDFDWSACGGTHCNSTGEVGVIKITGQEKIRGCLRFHFLTGWIALEDYRWRYNQIESISNIFTRHARESLDAVRGLADEYASLKKKYNDTRRQLQPYIIEKWRSDAIELNNCRIIVRDLSGEEIKYIKELAQAVITEPKSVFIAITEDKLLIAVSLDSLWKAGDLIKKAEAKFGGRGGGSAQMAQGGGFAPDKLKVLIEDPTIILD